MSPSNPEAEARENIDRLLKAAGWSVVDRDQVNIHAARGVAVREFSLKPGYGEADYLLYVDGQAAGVIEAKKEGTTLSGVEIQSDKYTQGLPDGLPRWHNPLPFAYESTGAETHFTNGLDPEPRARQVFAFHRPEMLAKWLDSTVNKAADGSASYGVQGKTFLERLRHMPPLHEQGLWSAQIKAIQNLEQSLRENRPRALVQMATGSGKTFTAISLIYRLIKFADARRVLFLVDRGNLGDQTLKEFQQYTSPYNNYKFSDEFNVQRLRNNVLDEPARVCICTIQRMYSMLKGREMPEDLEEESLDQVGALFKKPDPIEYNPKIPIETFDLIITDECHRSIYNLWAQVLEYFDAYLIGLTATPGKQTFGFFHRNLVMEYNHEMAVADRVNVNYDVYRIRTQITQAGSEVEAGYAVQIQERDTRRKRWQELDDDFSYDPDQLDRDVVAKDQIRTIIKTFKDKLFTDIFPARTEVPKTLVFAKDDNHAENIVEVLREEFAKGNEFAQKITYKTTGDTPQNLIKSFRNSFNPRIAVTVDMIATGTDIKPVEIVFFMRAVKSRSFFEQMKGRGVRIINPDDLKSVTPDATVKDHFVVVDAVGVCERDKTDSCPMEQKPTVSFDKLLQAIAFGNTEEDVLTSLAGRLARMEHRLSPEDDKRIRSLSGGLSVRDLAHRIVESLDPDLYPLYADGSGGGDVQGSTNVAGGRTPGATEGAQRARLEAVKPLCDPKLRAAIVEIKKNNEIVIDTVSADKVLEIGFSPDALDRAREVVQSFEKFIEDNKDEITALQIIYSMPTRDRMNLGTSKSSSPAPNLPARLPVRRTQTGSAQAGAGRRLSFESIKELADAIQKPPYLWTESQLWNAYKALEKSKANGSPAPGGQAGKRILTDLVSLVRFAIHQENELVPFPERVNANFKAWLASQAAVRPEPVEGFKKMAAFTPDQLRWLEMIRDHIAANLSIAPDDFEYAPFSQQGGLGKAHQLFVDKLGVILEELNQKLVA